MPYRRSRTTSRSSCRVSIAMWLAALFNEPEGSFLSAPPKGDRGQAPPMAGHDLPPPIKPRFNRLVSFQPAKIWISAGVLFGYEVASFTERPCFSPTGQHSHQPAKKSMGFFRSADKINKWLSLR